jgi:hypothetical protein
MSVVEYRDTHINEGWHVGMIVLDEERIWHFVSDTMPGNNNMGVEYGFKYSWWIGRSLEGEDVKEINVSAIDAMNQTIQIWLELAENGEDANWKKEQYKQYEHGCPLCQYAIDSGKLTMFTCGKVCPMVGHWGSLWNHMCDTPEASYYKWRNEGDPDERKVKARAIVNEMIKVRAEMIANLTKEETMKQESYTEMKIKRVEVVKKTTENTLRLKLVKEGNDTILLAVDTDGYGISGGCILAIEEDGAMSRCPCINKKLGLQLDAEGRIVIK